MAPPTVLPDADAVVAARNAVPVRRPAHGNLIERRHVRVASLLRFA
jgi:hypothetical protein